PTWPASNSCSSSSAFPLCARRARSRRPPRWRSTMSETTMTRPLLALLHLCDSLFPIGGFGYSDGLEAATTTGLVATPGDLQACLDVCLDEGVGRMDGPAMRGAWSAFERRDWPALCELDDQVTAMRPSSATRHSSRAMGLRLVTTWSALYPNRRL